MRFVSFSRIPRLMGVIVGARFGLERLRTDQEVKEPSPARNEFRARVRRGLPAAPARAAKPARESALATNQKVGSSNLSGRTT
jgi:hypothetical protein